MSSSTNATYELQQLTDLLAGTHPPSTTASTAAVTSPPRAAASSSSTSASSSSITDAYAPMPHVSPDRPTETGVSRITSPIRVSSMDSLAEESRASFSSLTFNHPTHTTPSFMSQQTRPWSSQSYTIPSTASTPSILDPRVESIQKQLAYQIAADVELQNNLKAFSSTLMQTQQQLQQQTLATPVSSAFAPLPPLPATVSRYEPRPPWQSYADTSFQPSSQAGSETPSASNDSSIHSSLSSSPYVGAQYSHLLQPPPLPAAPLPSPYPSTLSTPIAPSAAWITSARQAVEGEFRRHEATLAHARARIEAMKLAEQNRQKETQKVEPVIQPQPPHPVYYSTGSAPPTPVVEHQPPPLTAHVVHFPPSPAVPSSPPRARERREPTRKQEDLTSEEEEEVPVTRSRPRQQQPPRSSSSARPSSARSSSATPSHRAPPPPPPSVQVKKKASVNKGTFGTASRAVRETTTEKKKRPSTPQTPPRPKSARSESVTGRKSTPAVARTSPARPLPPPPPPPAAFSPQAIAPPTPAPSNDDSSLAWAERYKTLLTRNLALQASNKQLKLRNQASQGAIYQLNERAKQLQQENEEMKEELAQKEDKLTTAKSVLRTERENVAHAAARQIAAAEAAQLSEANKQRLEFEKEIETLTLSVQEHKKRTKTLQLAAHSLQTRLDQKTTENQELTRSTTNEITLLKGNLATAQTQLQAAMAKQVKLVKENEDLQSELNALRDQYKSEHAQNEERGAKLSQTIADRDEILEAFHALRKWGEDLMNGVREAGDVVEREDKKVKQLQLQFKKEADTVATAEQQRRVEREESSFSITQSFASSSSLPSREKLSVRFADELGPSSEVGGSVAPSSSAPSKEFSGAAESSSTSTNPPVAAAALSSSFSSFSQSSLPPKVSASSSVPPSESASTTAAPKSVFSDLFHSASSLAPHLVSLTLEQRQAILSELEPYLAEKKSQEVKPEKEERKEERKEKEVSEKEKLPSHPPVVPPLPLPRTAAVPEKVSAAPPGDTLTALQERLRSLQLQSKHSIS